MTHEKYCTRCQGVGQVDTGIMESPVTVCNDCNGTGLAQQRTWVGLTDEERKKLWNDWENAHVVEAVEARLKELNT